MKYFCNPLNLEYKYQFHRGNIREGGYQIFQEAADPSVIQFKGRYYLFVSMSLGVYVSDDLVDWEYYPLDKKLPLYDYAPDARVVGDYVYICASRADRNCNFYRTRDILNGPYEESGMSLTEKTQNRIG